MEKKCETVTNNLAVVYKTLGPQVEKRKFAICSKSLDFPREDISIKLIEWVEIVRALGVDKIFFYNLDIHQNIGKVLSVILAVPRHTHHVQVEDYYRDLDLVEVSSISLPGFQPHQSRFRHMYMERYRQTH